ncbi:hypothetical protein MWG46_02195 [Escherichia coli]|nr:hypothetical protein [Escherichia coli]
MTMAEATGRGAGIYPYSVPEISFVDAPYRRCIPSLTEPQPDRETPLRECAGIIKNDTHRVYRVNGAAALSPHSRLSGAMVEETGCLSLLIDDTEMDSLNFSTFLYSCY